MIWILETLIATCYLYHGAKHSQESKVVFRNHIWRYRDIEKGSEVSVCCSWDVCNTYAVRVLGLYGI